MGRRSFFFKDYVAHLILIVCAFALAGVVFCYQMSSYALHAKQTELRTTVQSLAEQSKLLEGTDSDVIRQIYMLSIARVAKEDELTVLITDADGNIEMGAKPDGTTYTLPGYHISAYFISTFYYLFLPSLLIWKMVLSEMVILIRNAKKNKSLSHFLLRDLSVTLQFDWIFSFGSE